ncbi:MAG: hypothetical protein IH616_07655, partial [Gemmatimonadales bacterium]|nr:hypothetical protein [Gemmatimonadales bacterium]
MGSGERPLAADRLLFGYNVLMVLLWIALATRVWYAPWLGLAHAIALPLPWLFARSAAASGRAMQALRELSPLLFLAVFWVELDLVRPALGLVGIDGPVAALDKW